MRPPARRVPRQAVALLLLLAWALGQLIAAPQATAAQRSVDDPLTAELRAWVADHGPLRFGLSRTMAPVAIVEGDEVTGGWGVALVELMGLKLGVDVEFVVYDTIDEIAPALQAGEFDLTVPMGVRDDLADFAASTIQPWAWTPLVFTTAGDTISGEADFAGRTVTTIPNSPLEALLATDHPELTYVKAETLPDAVRRMATGEVDLMFGPLAVIGHNLRNLDVTARPVGEPTRVIEVKVQGVADSDALAVANAGRGLLTDSELAITHVRWTGFDLTLRAEATVSSWVWRTLAVAVAGALLGTLFAVILRRRVRVATAALQDLTDNLESRVEEKTRQLATSNLHLRASNRLLAKFSRSVAHDLRGPVAAIGGLAQLLRSGRAPDDRRDEVLDRIIGSAARQDETILRMLDQAQRADEAATPALTGEDLQTWVVEILGPELVTHGAALSTDFPDQFLDVNVDVLARTLLNLAGNAVKHGGDGVHVELRLRPVEQSWLLEVADDGPGVPASQRAAIFLDGVRLNRSSRGSGLGLASVREAVTRAGGAIAVEESPSGGALFRVTLPRTEPAVSSDA